ncbi:hypothetical protein MTO96_032864 [Rhipicephalus appendiculatus]
MHRRFAQRVRRHHVLELPAHDDGVEERCLPGHAGITLVLEPAQVCPLTVLKLFELTVRAGIPPGVFNMLTGSGVVVGQAT